MRFSHMIRRGQWKAFLALGLSSVFLLLIFTVSEPYLSAGVFDTPRALLYRAAFIFTLPFRLLILPFFPPVNHHWPLSNNIAVSLGAPYFYYSIWFTIRLLVNARSRFIVKSQLATPHARMGRRAFLLGAAALCPLGYAVYIEPGMLRIRRYEVQVAGLPSALDGLRLAHISDTHYGPFMPLRHIEKVIEAANALRPDLVVLTGDYAHRTPTAIAPGIGVFGGVRSRYGAVAVLGNHDHWEGAEASRKVFGEVGIPLLDNTRMFLSESGLSAECPSQPAICVAGVGDLWEGEVLLSQALAGVPPGMPRILLSHSPDVAEDIGPDHRVDLMLSGHTHGGQMALPEIGPLAYTTRYGDRYIGGYCAGPYYPVIVSRGVGLAGPPARLMVPPEIGLVTLRRK